MASSRRDGLNFEILDEDILYSRRNDRFNCGGVRAIQRALPGATNVTVDAKFISFSLKDEMTRYKFETPLEFVNGFIKPFDEGKDVSEFKVRSFTIDHAIEAVEMKQSNREELMKKRTAARQKAPARKQVRGGHNNSAFNRFPPEYAVANLEDENTAGEDAQ